MLPQSASGFRLTGILAWEVKLDNRNFPEKHKDMNRRNNQETDDGGSLVICF
jgi:hypothetical protein